MTLRDVGQYLARKGSDGLDWTRAKGSQLHEWAQTHQPRWTAYSARDLENNYTADGVREIARDYFGINVGRKRKAILAQEIESTSKLHRNVTFAGSGAAVTALLGFGLAAADLGPFDDSEPYQEEVRNTNREALTKAEKRLAEVRGERVSPEGTPEKERKPALYQEVQDLLAYGDLLVGELTSETTLAVKARDALYKAVEEGVWLDRVYTGQIEIMGRRVKDMEEIGTSEYNRIVGEIEVVREQRAEVRRLLATMTGEEVKVEEVADLENIELTLPELTAETGGTLEPTTTDPENLPEKLSAARRLYAVMLNEADNLQARTEYLSAEIRDDVGLMKDLVDGMRNYQERVQTRKTQVTEVWGKVMEGYQEDFDRLKELQTAGNQDNKESNGEGNQAVNGEDKPELQNQPVVGDGIVASNNPSDVPKPIDEGGE